MGKRGKVRIFVMRDKGGGTVVIKSIAVEGTIRVPR